MEKFSSKEDGEVNRTIGKLYSGVPQVPPPATNVNEETGSSEHRKALPIWNKRQAILDAIENNQVVIIKGGESFCGTRTPGHCTSSDTNSLRAFMNLNSILGSP